MEWSQKRKIIYAASVASVILLLVSYPLYTLIHKPASCFDKKKNGTETGVDCGGVCALVCPVDVKSPRMVWAKAFPINGAYDVGAYMENVNTSAGLKNAHYTIRVIDKDGNVLAERKGTTNIAPASQILLFETGVSFEGLADRVDVLFDSADLARWTRATTEPSSIMTKNQSFKGADSKPRFDAVLVNTNPVNDVTNLTVSAIIYDSLRHPVGISKTFVDRIPPEGEQGIFFTWPSRLTKYAKGAKCTAPVDTMLIFDQSSAMNIGNKKPPEPLETVKNIAKAYLGYSGVQDKFGIASLATSSIPTDYELSSDIVSVEEKISSLGIVQSKTGGDLQAALGAAFAELQSSRHLSSAKQSILLFSNGNPTNPIDPATIKNKQYAQNSAAAVSETIRKSGVNIFAFGLGENVNETFLINHIAGGFSNYFSTSTPEILQTIHKSASETQCPTESFITEIVITPRAIFEE